MREVASVCARMHVSTQVVAGMGVDAFTYIVH